MLMLFMRMRYDRQGESVLFNGRCGDAEVSHCLKIKVFFFFFTFQLKTYNTYYLITLLTNYYTLLPQQYHLERKLRLPQIKSKLSKVKTMDLCNLVPQGPKRSSRSLNC